MYFWNIKELKNDLLNRPLSESESFKYLLANVAFMGLGVIQFLENNIYDVYLSAAIALITVIGTYYIYKCNQGANGENFLQKYVSISWVMGVRWTVLVALPATIIYLIIIGTIFSNIPEHTTQIDVVFSSLLYTSYFWLVGKHIKVNNL